MKSYTKLSEGWKELYQWLVVVIIGTIVLFVASCTTTKKVLCQEKIQQNKKVQFRRITTQRLPIAASQSELKIPLINLPSLDMDVYSRHQGQAQARVHIRSDTLYVEAHCDSLEEVIRMYEEVLNDKSSSLLEMTKKSYKLTFWQSVWISLGKISSIVLLLGLVYLLTKEFLSGWLSKAFQLIIKRIFKSKI